MKLAMLSRMIGIPFAIIAVSQLPAQNGFWVPKDPPKASYTMSVLVDTVTNAVSGEGCVTFKNSGSKPMIQIAFDWPNSPKTSLQIIQDSRILVPLNPGFTSFEPLVFNLLRPLEPNHSVTLRFSFMQKEIAERPMETIELAGTWYPHLWWDTLPTPDDYSVRITCPKEYEVAATGRPDRSGKKIEGRSLRHFAIFLGRNHKTLSRDIDGVLLSVMYPEDGRKVAEIAFQTASEAIPFFIRMFGSFPFPYLSIIPGYPQPWGGYNYAPGMAVIHGMQCFEKKDVSWWRWITAHEIGHHYWGECVYDGDDPSWIWIGLGIMTDREFMRSTKSPGKTYQGFLDEYFSDGVKEHVNTTMDITPEQLRTVTFDFNNIVTHAKGFTVMSALESVIGYDAMIEALKTCYKRYSWKTLSYRQFKTVCEEISGQNLGWFFEEWVRSSKHLGMKIGSIKNEPKGNGFLATVEVINTGKIRMPVVAEACFADGTRQRATVNRLVKRSVLSFSANSRLDSLIMDPDKNFPPITEEILPTDDELVMDIRELPYTDVGDAVMEPYETAKKTGMKSSDGWYSLGLRFYDTKDMDKCMECFVKAARSVELPTDSTRLMRAYCWQGMLLDEQGKRADALEMYKKALDVSTDSWIQHGQFNITISRKTIQPFIDKPYRRK
jgi:hypothetical protein